MSPLILLSSTSIQSQNHLSNSAQAGKRANTYLPSPLLLPLTANCATPTPHTSIRPLQLFFNHLPSPNTVQYRPKVIPHTTNAPPKTPSTHSSPIMRDGNALPSPYRIQRPSHIHPNTQRPAPNVKQAYLLLTITPLPRTSLVLCIYMCGCESYGARRRP